MTRTDLEQAVARAICQSGGGDLDADWAGEACWRHYLEDARAALAAIEREHVIVTRTQHQQDGAKS